MTFAPGYPSEFSLEVMDLVAGSRVSKTTGFRPMFIVRKAEGDVIGEIGGDLDKKSGAVMVGFSIVEPCWGQGYATEALGGLISHLLNDRGIDRVVAETFVDHGASRKVMEKAGMRCVGQHKGDGREAKLVTYQISRRAFRPSGRSYLVESSTSRR